ncbi:MAG: carbohydrate ABC transporter permease [Clostridia bacterium]|nr:carbohydrate ABC transporter permease [Clostridia bacterium]
MTAKTVRKIAAAKKAAVRWTLFVFFLGVSLVFVMPTVLTLTNSLMSQSEIAANYGQVFSSVAGDAKVFVAGQTNLKLIPDMVTFSQYDNVLLRNPQYLIKFWNSMILTLPIVAGQILIALLASYGFARFEGKLRSILFFTYVILMLMPYQVTLVPNYLVSEWLGLLDTRAAIILPGIFSPFAVFILTKFMRRIPTAMIEAAKLDGASEIKIFTRVCLPMSQSIVYSVAILVFIDYWNMVEQPLVLMKKAETLHPLSVFLSQINAGDAALAFAVASIYMVIPLLVFLYSEDYIIEGVSYSGGVKG